MLAVFGSHVAAADRVGVQRAVAPACGLPFGLGRSVAVSDALRHCEGGVLELSGVFGGRLSLARSATFSSSSTAGRLFNSSIRASNVAITASFSALDKEDESGGGATHTLTHIRPPAATGLRSSSQFATPHTPAAGGRLSNYVKTLGSTWCRLFHKRSATMAACRTDATGYPLKVLRCAN
jgi:hypothetical protein